MLNTLLEFYIEHQWLALPTPTPMRRAGNHAPGVRAVHALYMAARRADEFADRERYDLKRQLRDTKKRNTRFKRRLQRAVWYNAWRRCTGQHFSSGMRSLYP